MVFARRGRAIVESASAGPNASSPGASAAQSVVLVVDSPPVKPTAEASVVVPVPVPSAGDTLEAAAPSHPPPQTAAKVTVRKPATPGSSAASHPVETKSFGQTRPATKGASPSKHEEDIFDTRK